MDYGFRPHKNSARPDAAIENDGWFPALSLAEFATLYGIPNELDEQQVAHCLLLAMDRANQSLALWKSQKLAEGAATLENVATGQLGSKNATKENYKRAVYAQAKADLLRDAISMDRKTDAENAANSAVDMIDFYERQATRALANIQQLNAVGVHLI